MKKKIISLLTSLVMAVGLIGIMPIVTAGAETSGNYEYSVLTDGTAEITGYTGKASDLSIPNTLNGKKVTSIGRSAFENCNELTGIKFPNTVTSILANAFSNCTGLTELTISGSVKKIGNSAFRNCINLKTLTMSDGVAEIENNAFIYCKNLETVTIPSSVKSIGGKVFDVTKWLENKQKQNPLVIINNILIDGAKCSGNIKIPSGVIDIANYAFYSCEDLKSITFPDSLRRIGNFAFTECSGLTNITLPYNVTTIGSFVFSDCNNIKSVIIPKNVDSIGSEAFGFYTEKIDGWNKSSKVDGYKIYCYAGTAGEKYAKKWNFDYELLGYTVAGNVTSFGSDEDAETTITLTDVGSTESSYETTVSGTGKVGYSIPSVAAGKYTLSVSKKNHVTRTYDITVGYDDIVQDLKIHLTGDINGDGKVTTADVGLANSHAKGVKALEGYKFLCADVGLDSAVTTADVGRINSHAKGVKTLW